MAKTQISEKLEPIAEPEPTFEPVPSIAKALASTVLSDGHIRQAAGHGHSAIHLLAHAVSQIQDVTGTLRQLISTMPAYDSNIAKFEKLISRLV
jgi:hypothetical protein